MYIVIACKIEDLGLNFFRQPIPPCLQMTFGIWIHTGLRCNICTLLYFALKLYFTNIYRETGN